MDKFIIEGGVPLRGEVEISGAKNAVLPIMAASLLASGKSIIYNVPDVQDVKTMMEVLKILGANVLFVREEKKLEIDTLGTIGYETPYDIVKKMRASYYVLGPLLAKQHRARVSLPGGCAIGARPIDLHLKGMEALSAEIDIRNGYIEARCNGLKGNYVYLMGKKGTSVGATINVLMAATLAEGKTVIEGAALEPEVENVSQFLNKMGARIEGVGTQHLEIEGVEELHPAEIDVIPDRIEAGTFAVAGIITDGDITIKNINQGHFSAVIEKLREVGGKISNDGNGINVKRTESVKSTDLTVAPYPGFPTDMQAQFMALMTIADGISVITETIFENRFMHVLELNRMGADITIDGNSAVVKGVKNLYGAPVMASDLRASAALVLAGLIAIGKTEVHRVYHIDRGYERIEEKITKLGGKIWRERE